MNMIKRIGVLCLPWFLVACATLPAPVNERAQPQPVVEPTIKPKVKPKLKAKSTAVDKAAQAPAAVLALLKRAQQQQSNGNDQAAQASVERAIRIAPRYPESYFRLGELRFKQGSYAQARSLAQKAISLGADRRLRRQAQSLVKRASSAQ